MAYKPLNHVVRRTVCSLLGYLTEPGPECKVNDSECFSRFVISLSVIQLLSIGYDLATYFYLSSLAEIFIGGAPWR